jgi:beta-glucosidase
MALGAIAQQDLELAKAYAEKMGAITAQEALAIGINWLFAPVVDVNNNPANPVINIRAFGEDPATVSQLTTAFIQGAQQHRVLTTAKHFPGHGDTAVDSHLSLPVLPHSPERLAAVEFAPFVAAIAAHVNAVMTAHVQIPALDPDVPATLSRKLLTEELRQRLGFEGLIVTDALIMGAITDRYGVNEAPVLAVEAGADIVLMPVDPAGAIAAICQAVEAGRISAAQIQASVERIWRAKQAVCTPSVSGDTSHAWEQVPPPPIQLEQIATAEAIDTAQAILQASMQVHRPTPCQLEQATTKPLRNLIVVDDALNCNFLGRQTAAIALPQQLGYQLQIVDSYTPQIKLDPDRVLMDLDLHPDTQDWQPILLQLFIRSNPFRDSAGLLHLAQDWLKFLVKTEQLQAVILYGTPYGSKAITSLLPADVPYVFSYGQMDAAQAIALKALFGEVKFQSKVFTD